MNWLIILMMLSSTMVVIQLGGRESFLLTQILFCGVAFIYKKYLVFFQHRMLNMIFITLGLSAVSACLGDIPYSYKKAAVVMTIFMIPLYFALTYLYDLMKKDKGVLTVILKGFKLMCLIQLFWIPAQFVLYRGLGIDINKILFVDLFHFVDNATFIRDWTYYPSGLTWHSAVLAPMFVMAMVLFKNPLIRGLILLDAAICGNSTALIGVCLCVGLLFLFYLKKNAIRVPFGKPELITLGILGAVGLGVLAKMGIIDMILDKVVHMAVRILGGSEDASTAAHMAYFTDYFKILPNSTPLQVLFGYGYGCSGYPISEMYGRYAGHSNWAVECDIINILLSRGICGFIAHYAMMFYVAIKGYRLDYRYVVVMIPIFIQGFGYNIQWDYVLFMEILMFLTIKMGINLFDYVTEEKAVWIKERN